MLQTIGFCSGNANNSTNEWIKDFKDNLANTSNFLDINLVVHFMSVFDFTAIDLTEADL